MESVAQVVLGVAILSMLAGAVWHTVRIFRFSSRWDWLCTLVPVVYLVFLLKHGEVVREPFRLELGALGLLLIGMLLLSV